MHLKDIALLRLISQQIAEPQYNTVKDLVNHMGAMQAQDYPMLQWAVSIRLNTSSNHTLDTAVTEAEVIRTHVLRPTWHLVTAEDISWMLDLTAPHIRSGLRSRHRQLELDQAVVLKSIKTIVKALEKYGPLPRSEISSEIEKTGVSTADNRISHLLLLAELDMIICSGPLVNGSQTYALFDERIGQKKKLPHDEALSMLAGKYFNSHYPATINDFIWWSGLPLKEARKAMQMIQSNFISEIIAGQDYWIPDTVSESQKNKKTVFLLPAYDEFLISYKERGASLPFEFFNKAVSNNGIFRPVIVIDGQVNGTWKRTKKNDKILLETEMFKTPDKKSSQLIERAAMSYAKFCNREIIISKKN